MKVVKEEDEAPTEPDKAIVEALYAMGFPLEMAKKAALKSKNAGVQ